MIVPSPATRDLWRIAESGEVHKLESVLPSAEINARNEHGMTALMRAARHGRTRMVRALLEHGADPNVARSDNFTALSLAAFFGHTEIVEMLLKHGARTDVATRFDTSPHMWASARSFKDVARCLEKRNDQTGGQVKPKPAPVIAPAKTPVEVKTLKDPPEIWDLVHEAPQQFNAGSAFITRIRSIGSRFVLRAAVLLIVAGVGLMAVWVWRGDSSQASKADTVLQPMASLPVTPAPEPVTVTAPAVIPENNDEQSAVVSTPGATINPPVNVTRRSRSFARSRSTEDNLPRVNTIETAPVTPAPVVAPKPDSRTENAAKNRTTTPLSPQLISPPKSSQSKAKVIQWP